MAAEISQELADLKETIEKTEEIKKEIIELNELISLKDTSLEKDLEAKLRDLETKIKQKEKELFLSGKYDKGNAVLSISSGAGGQDAQDWATILQRMYERYCQLNGFKTKILHQSFGQAGGPEARIGTKNVVLEIKGKFAFGLLKKETGVHRLVRLSPFSAKNLRHTSFAQVEVLPEIPKKDLSQIEIKPEDVKIETFRASGPGGQYVNKRDSAVRIHHFGSGITVSCQSERLQGQNKKKALEVLAAKLYRLQELKAQKEVKDIKSKTISPSWGRQIRSYVLHPYTMVKDMRTGVEISNVQAVLDGKLDKFIDAEIYD